MPAKKRTNKVLLNLCTCFDIEREPPEITYQVVGGAVVSLQPSLSAFHAPPLPPEDELNHKFSELVEELDLTEANKKVMYNLPPEKKWQLYLSKKLEQEECSSSRYPDYYVERVKAMALLLFPCDEEEVTVRAKLLDNLRTALRTQPNSFVTRFLNQDGLSTLLFFLQKMDYNTAESPIHTALIGCVKALMNNSNGRSHVLAHSTAIQTIAQSLSTRNTRTKVAVLEILGAVCLVPGGHKKVLDAMLHYQKYAGERTRFQTLVNDLNQTTGDYREDVTLKTAILSFINAIINYGAGQDHVEFRLHLRYEFLMLGIQPVLDRLRSHENGTLDRHIDIFEMIRNEDEKELARRYQMLHVDTKSAHNMFEVIHKKLAHSAAFPHFLSLLQHVLLLPMDTTTAYPQHWLLLDRLVQQVVLQGELGEDPDISLININVRDVVQLLATEEEMKRMSEKLEILEQENNELTTTLAKKEHELEVHVQEKEELQAKNGKLMARLEKESVGNLEANQKIAELEFRVKEFAEMLQLAQKGAVQSSKVESLIHNGSLCDDVKAEIHQSSSTVQQDVKPMVNGVISPPCEAPPPPPPPPPGNGIPPPPPLMPVKLLGSAPLIKKNIPQPTAPLKSFNWSKLPEGGVEGTLWTELDDTKLYKDIDLGEFDKVFSAYQKQCQGEEELASPSAPSSKTSGGSKPVLTVIDGRRAQNCTILLSKLRMTNDEICQAILSMDPRDKLPKDMVEQLLKYIPSPEEKALLEEHSMEIETMARADRFLFDIGKITHYEQRLRTLFYKKRFNERNCELKPKMEVVMEASKEVQRSKRLKKLLELVLAIGNYMNRGQRGNAYGFRIASLNRINDTKSSLNRHLTLLHYLVDIIEKKFKDVLKLESDLPSVRKATKVSMAEMESEIRSLRSGLQEIQKELEYYRSNPSPHSGDQYVPVMKEFITGATFRISELEDSFQDMKIRYEKVVKMFGENPTNTPPDEFFGIFDTFLTAFHEAHLENVKRRKEEEERRPKVDSEGRRKDHKSSSREQSTTHRKCSTLNSYKCASIDSGISSDKGEFDDLILALRAGDVFVDDFSKSRSRHRRRSSHHNSSPTHHSPSSHLVASSRERGVAKSSPRIRC